MQPRIVKAPYLLDEATRVRVAQAILPLRYRQDFDSRVEVLRIMFDAGLPLLNDGAQIGGFDERGFNSLFEMGDGDAVRDALVTMANKAPESVLAECVAYHGWIEPVAESVASVAPTADAASDPAALSIFCEYNDRYGNGPSISFSFLAASAEAAAQEKAEQVRAMGAMEACWPMNAPAAASAEIGSGPDAASSRLAGSLAQLGQDLHEPINFNVPDQRAMLRESLLESLSALAAYEQSERGLGDVPRTFFVEGYWDGNDYVNGFVDATGLPASLFEHLEERYDSEPIRFYLKDVEPATLISHLEKCGAFRVDPKMAEVIEAEVVIVRPNGLAMPMWERTRENGHIESIAVDLPERHETIDSLHLEQLDDDLTVRAKP